MNRRKMLKILAIASFLPIFTIFSTYYRDWQNDKEEEKLRLKHMGEDHVHVNGWILKRSDLQ